jgi:hypothetical protein
MKTGIYIGLALGMVAGALLVNNNYHARRFVDETQEKVKSKIRQKGKTLMNDNCCCEAASDDGVADGISDDVLGENI